MINTNRLVSQFKTMVEFDSETYHEREIADYLTLQLKELGFEVEEDDAGIQLKERITGYGNQSPTGNLYGRLKGNTEGSPVLLSAHMDTVRPGIGKRAIEDEHGVITSEGETILGADDLSGVAAILEAVRVIKEENLSHPDIEILFPVAEENYGKGSQIFDYSKVSSNLAYVFDLSGEIGLAATAAPTLISFEIRIQGRNAHAGFCPQLGINAIEIGAHAISQLMQGWVDEVTTVNIGKISGGKQTNIVPDDCIILGEIRSLKDERALEQLEKLREIFSKTAALYEGSIEFIYEKQIEAYEIGDEEEVVKRFRKVCGQLGLTPVTQVTLGGSDNNHFVKNGIRGIVVACGMNEVHTTKEYTTVDQLEKTASLALGLITVEYDQ
ncbi:M20/M25/M40 family metallo-hydrolase [Lacrimispora xylanolytica]|uniref:M20/M25/M40 family metallo-hydrolase n=1 Tax=Lacrimispora xylanolytica TaxID=29375 RepID=A0ABY7AHZ1_9FIRM|nr:M20/M25/M40 family metallo-hydrolase [Lacrimispora xylanolytica]WAJ25101.1 M20/M25/M40 family metallo-hydrolase [Lacrimispora xylanolytica]